MNRIWLPLDNGMAWRSHGGSIQLDCGKNLGYIELSFFPNRTLTLTNQHTLLFLRALDQSQASDASMCLPETKWSIMDSGGRACAEVFGVNEILENILLCRPVHELLVLQRVCKRWYLCCWRSSKIRKILFFEPFDSSVTANIDWMDEYDREDGEYAWQTPDAEISQLIVNPFMSEYMHAEPVNPNFKTEHGILLRFYVEPLINAVDPIEPLEPAPPKLEIFHRADSSWRSMQFTQHAIRDFYFWCSKSQVWCRVQNQRGIRMGQIVKAMKEHLSTCINCPIYYEEENRWTWMGELDVKLSNPNITGHEMWEKFEEHFKRESE